MGERRGRRGRGGRGGGWGKVGEEGEEVRRWGMHELSSLTYSKEGHKAKVQDTCIKVRG